mgnify:CR=1 FL=1
MFTIVKMKLLFEMLFVGAALVFVAQGIELLSTGKISSNQKMIKGTFVAGAAFHFIAEWSGLNAWYVRQYKPLL